VGEIRLHIVRETDKVARPSGNLIKLPDEV
jgi:hypothetical protein